AAHHRLRPGKVAGRVGFYILIVAFVVGSLFPFYWIVITSLKTPEELSAGTTSLLPGHITFGSYSADLTQTSTTGLNFGRSLLTGALAAPATTGITFVLAVLAGYALSRTRMRGRGSVLGFVLIAVFFPPLAMVGPLFRAYRHISLLNSYPALVITYLIYTLP